MSNGYFLTPKTLTQNHGKYGNQGKLGRVKVTRTACRHPIPTREVAGSSLIVNPSNGINSRRFQRFLRRVTMRAVIVTPKNLNHVRMGPYPNTGIPNVNFVKGDLSAKTDVKNSRRRPLLNDVTLNSNLNNGIFFNTN